MQPRQWRVVSLILALVLGMCGCGAPTDGELLGNQSQPILNGTEADPTELGVVLVAAFQWPQWHTLCSGTLLTNTWVLTARHCLSAHDRADPSSVYVSLEQQRIRAAEVMAHPSLDVMLIRLERPFVLRGTDSGYHRGIAYDSMGLAAYYLLRCTGYGAEQYFEGQSPAVAIRAGAGVYREAVMRAFTPVDGFARVLNNGDKAMFEGDSGASCFVIPGAQPWNPAASSSFLASPNVGRIMGVLHSMAGTLVPESDADLDGEVAYPSEMTVRGSFLYTDHVYFRDWLTEATTTRELRTRDGRCIQPVGRFLGAAPCDGSAKQRWRLSGDRRAGGWAQAEIRNAASGRCATRDQFDNVSGMRDAMRVLPVLLQGCRGSHASQLWKISVSSDGNLHAYWLFPAMPTHALMITSDSIALLVPVSGEATPLSVRNGQTEYYWAQ